MNRLILNFAVEVTSEERQLNGRRLLSLEGIAVGQPDGWSVLLNLSQPKEPAPGVDEGDLALSGPDGELFADLEGGRADKTFDEDTGLEQEELDLIFRAEADEMTLQLVEGEVRVHAMLTGHEGNLRLEAHFIAQAEN